MIPNKVTQNSSSKQMKMQTDPGKMPPLRALKAKTVLFYESFSL